MSNLLSSSNMNFPMGSVEATKPSPQPPARLTLRHISESFNCQSIDLIANYVYNDDDNNSNLDSAKESTEALITSKYISKSCSN